MPYVEIYKLQDDGTQRVIASCKLVGDEVVCEGDKVFVESLKGRGIKNYDSKEQEQLYPKDGLKFLKQLQNNFRSGYLTASEIKE